MITLFVFLVMVLIYVLRGRHVINTWGATKDEVRSILPGDDLISSAQGQSTRAITINAPVAKVWQWLVQVGQGRGGFFSYDWLENLFGLDIHTLNAIVPELQHLTVGDEIRFGKNGPIYYVAKFEPQHALILRMPDQQTGEYANPTAPNYYDATWGFILNPLDDHTTRFVIRGRGASNTLAGRLINEIIGPIGFIMERKMLQGIKKRAEKTMSGQTLQSTQA